MILKYQVKSRSPLTNYHPIVSVPTIDFVFQNVFNRLTGSCRNLELTGHTLALPVWFHSSSRNI